MIYHQKKNPNQKQTPKRVSHKSEPHTIARSYFSPFDLVFTGGKKNPTTTKNQNNPPKTPLCSSKSI